MTIKEWSCCPLCKLPANYSDLKKLLEADPTCPMCEQNCPAVSVTMASDPDMEFKALTALMKESRDEETEGGNQDEDEEDDEAMLK
jgi:hypothetical protein